MRDRALPPLSAVAELAPDSFARDGHSKQSWVLCFPDAVHTATGMRSSSLPSFLLEEIPKFLHKDGEKIGLTKILCRCTNLERAFCKFFIRLGSGLYLWEKKGRDY